MQAVEKSDGELALDALLDGDATAPRLRERDALTERDAAAPPRLGERDALTVRDATPPLRETLRDALTDRDVDRVGDGVTIVHCT